MITQDERRVEVLLFPYQLQVWNIKVLNHCQILEWKKDLLNKANYMVSLTNESYVMMFIT
jgi:hypothetical protein